MSSLMLSGVRWPIRTLRINNSAPKPCLVLNLKEECSLRLQEFKSRCLKSSRIGLRGFAF